MEFIISLPKSTGFDVEMDDDIIHSKYESIKKPIFLKRGTHVLSIRDQAPTPSFWVKIIKFFNPLTDIGENYSEEVSFTILEDATVTVNIIYGDFSCVDITPSGPLSQIIENADEVF